MIPVCEPTLDGNEKEYVNQALNSGWISSEGEFLTRFEQEFARYCGRSHGVAVTSGTTALHLALASIGIKEGDEVIIPDLTIISCALAVLWTGAKPVVVDCEPDHFNIDPARIEDKITPHTRAIMPVHLYGSPAEMDEIMDIARRHRLYVIEDAAEAHGAAYKGRKVGGIGHIGAFSFFANKLLTTGEGGMIVTDDPQIADKARSLRNLAHSRQQRFLHHERGYNYRMTNVQAAIGVAQLESLQRHIDMRRSLLNDYACNLWETEGVKVLSDDRSYVDPVTWMCCAVARNEETRSRVMNHLGKAGVQTRTFFLPLSEQPALRSVILYQNHPQAHEASRRGFYLPSKSGLSSDAVAQICTLVKEAL